MMEVITASFQMLLQWTATKVTKHGIHQDHPGRVTANTHNSSVQADAFPVLALHVVERRTMPITGPTENPTATDYFWVLSAVQPCKFSLSPHGRRWQALNSTEWHDWHPGYRQEHIQLWRDAQELTAGPQHGKDGLDTLLGSTCCLFICAPGWTRVFLWNLCIFTQVLRACYPGTQLCLLGQRDSLIWHTDALSELKSWQNSLIIFARAPQGRQAVLSRCASHFLAY